jgi:hypothetical protein
MGLNLRLRIAVSEIDDISAGEAGSIHEADCETGVYLMRPDRAWTLAVVILVFIAFFYQPVDQDGNTHNR